MCENGKTISTTELGDIQLLGASSTYQQPVVVEMSVVKRLTEQLMTTYFSNIKNRFRKKLREVDNMKDYVTLLEEEVAFHRTVNEIRELETEKTGLKQVGKIELSEDVFDGEESQSV